MTNLCECVTNAHEQFRMLVMHFFVNLCTSFGLANAYVSFACISNCKIGQELFIYKRRLQTFIV